MYTNDHIQFPILTPNILTYRQPLTVPEDQVDDDGKIIKRQSYLEETKNGSSMQQATTKCQRK